MIHNRTEITVDSNGYILLPDWIQIALLKSSGIRSKKRRIQNKVIKREFFKALAIGLEKLKANHDNAST